MPTPTVDQALKQVQDNPNGTNDAQAKAVLAEEATRIWRRIQAKPNDYVMNGREFPIFNYIRTTTTEYNNPTAQQAVQRYWNNYRG